MHHLYQTAAIVAWTVALILFGSALAGAGGTVHRYAFGCLFSFAAMTCTYLATIESLITKAFSKEAATSRAVLASAVAKALTDELEDRAEGDGNNGDGSSRVHHMRR